ncbi:MAG: hypothetical protein MMC33_002084 [Icmadophila ericetorum]|nr:hypothetical protein [Icmadophila ericetorum]
MVEKDYFVRWEGDKNDVRLVYAKHRHAKLKPIRTEKEWSDPGPASLKSMKNKKKKKKKTKAQERKRIRAEDEERQYVISKRKRDGDAAEKNDPV